MPSILDSTNALTALATVNTYAGIASGDDNTVERLINGASLLLNSLTNRKLLARSLTEYYTGDGSSVILLKQRPCNSVTSIYDDPAYSYGADTLVSSDDYQILSDEGKIIAVGTAWSTTVNALKVTYNGGLSAVPVDLEMACIELTVYWYNKYFKQKIGIKSVSNDGRNVTYIDDIPGVVYTIADKYRKYWVG